MFGSFSCSKHLLQIRCLCILSQTASTLSSLHNELSTCCIQIIRTAWLCPVALSWAAVLRLQCQELHTNFFFFFWLHFLVCRISVPQPVIEPTAMTVKAWILTTRPPGNSRLFLLIQRVCWLKKKILKSGRIPSKHPESFGETSLSIYLIDPEGIIV